MSIIKNQSKTTVRQPKRTSRLFWFMTEIRSSYLVLSASHGHKTAIPSAEVGSIIKELQKEGELGVLRPTCRESNVM